MVKKIVKDSAKSSKVKTTTKAIAKAPKTTAEKCTLSQRGVIAKTPGRSDFKYIM